MENIPPNLRIYQQILKDLENALPFLNVPKAKAGRKPKLTDIASVYTTTATLYNLKQDTTLVTFFHTL